MGRVNDGGGGVVSSTTRRTVMVAGTAMTFATKMRPAMDKVKNSNLTDIIINTDTFFY